MGARSILSGMMAVLLAAWPGGALRAAPAQTLPAGQDGERQAAPLPEPAAQERGGVIRREVRLVLVEATVKNRAGQVMDGLSAEDFQVYEDGVAQKVAHFSRDELPLAVAVVVDLSGSIEPFLRPLRYATATALRALKPDDEVALFTFTHHVRLVAPLSSDKRAAGDHLEYVRAGGGTNINDAVYEAARYLRDQAPAARRVIVLVSDNVPSTRGAVTHNEVVEAALEADAAVYGLKVPGRNPPGMGLAAGRMGGLVNVGRLVEATGGEIFDIEKEGSLYLAFQALIERLKTRYTLGYYPEQTASDGRFRKLDVRLAAGHGARGRDYRIVAKSGYYPPPAGQPAPGVR